MSRSVGSTQLENRNRDGLGLWGRCAEIRSGYDVDGAMVFVTELYGCDPKPSWIANPATVEADDPGNLVGVLASELPAEFVAVVGPPGAAERVADDIVRAPIEGDASGGD